MIIKELDEIKGVIEKFPEASKSGYVIMPQLLKIASQLGLMGYDQALTRWLNSDCTKSIVYPTGADIYKDENNQNNTECLSNGRIFISYKGLPIRMIQNEIFIGIKETLDLIDRVVGDIADIEQESEKEDI